MPSPPRIRSRRRPPALADGEQDAPPVELNEGAAPPPEPLPSSPGSRRRRKGKSGKPEPSSAERLKSLPAARPEAFSPPHRVRNVKAAKARQRAARRPALVAGIIVTAILSAVVAVTGLLVASEMKPPVTDLKYPLQVYPVAQSSPGECLTGTQGVTGPGPFCYQVTQGFSFHRVSSIQEQHDKTLGYVVYIRLRQGDRSRFADLTRQAMGRSLLFVVRERLVTVSHVDTPILGGQILITGLSGKADADRVLRNLKGKA